MVFKGGHRLLVSYNKGRLYWHQYINPTGCAYIKQPDHGHAMRHRCYGTPGNASFRGGRGPTAALNLETLPVHRDDILELVCERLAYGGRGICKAAGGFIVFVDRGLPGETLQAQIKEVHREYATAVKIHTVQAHVDAVTPPCQHFGTCGGCLFQNLAYAAQLEAKRQQVVDILQRVAKVKDAVNLVAAPVGSPSIYHHRNKMRFSATSANRLGLLKAGTNTVLPISECWLQDDEANKILQVVNASLEAHEQQLGHKVNQPLVQSLTVRKGVTEDGGPSYMAIVQTAITSTTSRQQGSAAPSRLSIQRNPSRVKAQSQVQGSSSSPAPLVDEAMALGLPSGAGVPAAVSSGRQRGRGVSQTADEGSVEASGEDGLSSERFLRNMMGDLISNVPHMVSVVHVSGKVDERGRAVEKADVLWGAEYLHQRLCGLDLSIGPLSFFQTNSAQAEALCKAVQQQSGLREGASDVVLDLYCGAGAIGLTLAKNASKIIGYDSNRGSIQDAQLNAQQNKISNASFFTADLSSTKGVMQLYKHVPVVDVVIADPGREGLGRPVSDYLRSCKARTIVYVSCNPSTQARDIHALCKEGLYILQHVQPFDMFPHTYHIESMAVLARSSTA